MIRHFQSSFYFSKLSIFLKAYISIFLNVIFNFQNSLVFQKIKDILFPGHRSINSKLFFQENRIKKYIILYNYVPES